MKVLATKADLKLKQDKIVRLDTELLNTSRAFLYFKKTKWTVKLVLSKSTDLSSESIVTPTTTNNSLYPSTK